MLSAVAESIEKALFYLFKIDILAFVLVKYLLLPFLFAGAPVVMRFVRCTLLALHAFISTKLEKCNNPCNK